jgi:hypothetical protein
MSIPLGPGCSSSATAIIEVDFRRFHRGFRPTLFPAGLYGWLPVTDIVIIWGAAHKATIPLALLKGASVKTTVP